MDIGGASFGSGVTQLDISNVHDLMCNYDRHQSKWLPGIMTGN